jgi:hypothetical protein
MKPCVTAGNVPSDLATATGKESAPTRRHLPQEKGARQIALSSQLNRRVTNGLPNHRSTILQPLDMGFRMLIGADMAHIHSAPIAANYFLRNMGLSRCSFVADSTVLESHNVASLNS